MESLKVSGLTWEFHFVAIFVIVNLQVIFLVRYVRNVLKVYVKVPLQAWTGPEGSRKLRFPDFVTTAPADFTPRKCSWYSFLLESESTAGP